MSNHAQRLTAVLGEQLRCAQAMLDTLTRESQALADGDHAALGSATGTKAELVETLEKLETERRLLAEPDGAAGSSEWQRLREVIGLCKEQNQRNGLLLKARAESVRIALKALRGSEPDLYSATGRTPSRADARTLGSA
jgi:flagellar biosynthesis/type III secretory pathway chaperone